MAKDKLQEKFAEGRGYTKEDWDAVDSPEISEAEFERMVPAKAVLPADFFVALKENRRGRPPIDNPRRLVTLRLDEDVLAKFKAGGKGWQTRLNETLRKAVGL